MAGPDPQCRRVRRVPRVPAGRAAGRAARSRRAARAQAGPRRGARAGGRDGVRRGHGRRSTPVRRHIGPGPRRRRTAAAAGRGRRGGRPAGNTRTRHAHAGRPIDDPGAPRVGAADRLTALLISPDLGSCRGAVLREGGQREVMVRVEVAVELGRIGVGGPSGVGRLEADPLRHVHLALARDPPDRADVDHTCGARGGVGQPLGDPSGTTQCRLWPGTARDHERDRDGELDLVAELRRLVRSHGLLTSHVREIGRAAVSGHDQPPRSPLGRALPAPVHGRGRPAVRALGGGPAGR